MSIQTRKRDRHRAVPLLPEVRRFEAAAIEVRELADTNEAILRGTPIVYDTPYSVWDMFGEFEERMDPGVADEVLARGADIRFLFDHGGLPLGRSTSGTLTVTNGPSDMGIEVRLDMRQQTANDLYLAVARGDVNAMSCGFIVGRDEWNDDMDKRTIFSFAELLDVSAVTYPASPTTSISVAQRMALAVPVESRARVRQRYLHAKQTGDVNEALEALRPILEAEERDGVDVDPGPDTQTPDGTGRLGSPDGDGKTYADTGQSADGSQGGEQTGVDTGADGSVRSERPSDAEHRAQVDSLDVAQRAAYDALEAAHGEGLYPLDVGRDWIVWRSYGDTPGVYHLPFTVDDDGNVTFRGEPHIVAAAEGDATQTSPSSRAKALHMRAKALEASRGA